MSRNLSNVCSATTQAIFEAGVNPPYLKEEQESGGLQSAAKLPAQVGTAAAYGAFCHD